MRTQRIIVVGAGIIGVSCALALRERGYAVTLVDRKGVAAETSRGNAGAFAFADIIPLATPGITRKALQWLFDPLGPLSIPPSQALEIAPWLLRFWRASRPDRYQASIEAQAALMALSRAALKRQIAATGADALFRDEGNLQLYEGEAQFRAGLPGWAEREARGIPFRHLTGAGEIAGIQPGLSPRFSHATFTADWKRVTDPAVWTKTLAEAFRARGGRIETANIRALHCEGDRVRLRAGGVDLSAEQVVVCAGVWSRALARSLGHRIPLVSERGYNTTLPAGAFDLRTQLTFGGHGFVVTRIGDGVRVGGASELAGLGIKPNFEHSQALLAKAAEFMPGLDTQGGQAWMGHRPSMPDTLPVIGTAPGRPGVSYAFGHGHLGLTQSAGTAEIVADLVSGRTPAIDLTAFRPDRYRRFRL